MDYAFAPGATSYDRYMRRVFTYMPDLYNVSTEEADGISVEDFVQYLIIQQINAPEEFPPSQIFIASHANDTGWMEIDLDTNETFTETSYEAIEMADDLDALDIPQEVVKGDDIFVTSTIQIKGCNIGKAEPFLERLKTAFGNFIPFIKAPKHYHYLLWSYASRGIFEYMMYDFAVIQKERFRTRADIISAFQNANLTFIDASPVPNDQWTRWIPRRFYRRGKQIIDMRVELGTTAANLTRINATREFRYRRSRESISIPDINSRPDASNHRNLLRTHLLTYDAFQEDHPFPYYIRKGYANIDEFLDEINWSYTWIRSENELRCTGTRHEYRILIPVLDPATNNLLFNFHPRTGTSFTAVNNMPDSDSRLFTTT